MKFLEDIEELEKVTLKDVSNIAAKVLMNPTIYILRAGD
jgi:predicted Zn-dependent peptidase